MPKKPGEVVTGEWLRTVRAALTDDVSHLALRYAYGRVELMKRAEVVVQGDEATALANDAIADTFTRVRVWDPARVKLSTHLCGVIRSRTNARIARVRKIRHETIATFDDDQGGDAEVAASLAVEDTRARVDSMLSTFDLAGKVIGRLRAAAAGDAELEALLGLYARGVTVRPAVMRTLGWELSQFNKAKRRLGQLARELAPTDRATR